MRWPRRHTRPLETTTLPAGVVQLARRLPDPQELRRHCQGLAMLDAIQAEDPTDRYYSFDASWSPTEQLASMDDGSGNSWSITFTPDGAWLRGFDHESPMSPYGEPFDLDWLAAVPQPLRATAAEVAFTDGDLPLLTLACWWLHLAQDEETGPHPGDEQRWHPVQLRSSVPADLDDGSGWLLSGLDADPDTYRSFAADYYETELERDDTAHVLALRPLSEELVRRLNPQRTLAQLAEDIVSIGYPKPT
ncbi:hypothetical protein OG218_00420 [Kineococcus sp. NBC_00420]|uniref:hypothetical protein n=1 Tax=Kineococcus sp. NBC_00420 TaxID=2903564 RepID=UPI002E23E3E4